MTFADSRSYEMAAKHMLSKKSSFFKQRIPNERHAIFGESPVITKAPQPSNIIWENYSTTESDARKRRCGALFATLILMLTVFTICLWIRRYPIKFDILFP